VPGAFKPELLDRLRLTPDHALSADGDSFVTLRCHDESGRPVVLKYVSSSSPDAYRRLTNESRLLTGLPTRPPLRLLARRYDGPGYLVTDHDSGRLLRPERLDDDVMLATIADALVEFQSARIDAGAIGVVDREHRATYYFKVLFKHIIHLWPDHLSAAEALRAVALVSAALPAILSRRVPCHGDFLPTNLLYHAEDRSVTLTDLEGFMSANHPLFDVLALFTIYDKDIDRWNWQPRFLRCYLMRCAAAFGLDPASRHFRAAYRGILVFFLVYRLNETRIGLSRSKYFDGLGKVEYLKRKLAGLIRGQRGAGSTGAAAVLEVRKRNLRRVLSTKGYLAHLDAMLAAASA
jgi:hypothetical protein